MIACTSAEKRERERGLKAIHGIYPYNVHVRRPPYPGSDPAVGPGGPDYRSNPPPNERFDCQPLSEIFRPISRERLKACFDTLKGTPSFQYRLKRDPAPKFVLIETENTPPCLKEALPEIPLPREIIFQSIDEGFLSCYASRLNLEADEILWVKVPKAKTLLQLSIPKSELLETDEKFGLLLMSWMMTPFFDSNGSIYAKVLPEPLCIKCMGEGPHLDDKKPLPDLWP